MTENKRAREPREFMIFDGETANPKLSQRKGLPIAYAENVHVIEYSEVERLEAENDLLKRGEICGYCDFDNSLRKERDALEAENQELKSKIEDINKNSISLFLHEQRMAQVDEQLADYQQVVEFYADESNWNCDANNIHEYTNIDKSDIGVGDFMINDDTSDRDVGGKLARAMQSKWGK